ncbi:unnamed protein product [Sphagnum troendelagicum]|uniref:PPM-type phosphatase domain-containing protein n=1 Tax=Sphagnum troendelagicum TaxID=128251 RepID=A0ABP0UH00_9BRYO
MGNKVSRAVGSCLIPSCREELGNPSVVLLGNYEPPPPPPADEGLGHSFCYVRPPTTFSSDSISWELSFESETAGGGERSRSMSETSFKAISGASVSANTATPSSIMSTSLQEQQFNNSSNNILFDRASSFESTSSFSALPLQPVPRGSIPNSGPLSGPLPPPPIPLSGASISDPTDLGALSGSLERGFLSGPLERGFMSGPMERGALSGPLEAAAAELHPVHKQRRRSKVGVLGRFVQTLSGPLQKALSRSMEIMLEKTHHSLFVPMKLFVMGEAKEPGLDKDLEHVKHSSSDSPPDMGGYMSSDSNTTKEQANLQWAQGKAGEDRVHVVLSEEHGWLFVGIYDGFNGPDAPDFLMNNLYPSIYRELKGLLWDQDDDEFDFFPGISIEKKGTVLPGAESDVEGDEIQRLVPEEAAPDLVVNSQSSNHNVMGNGDVFDLGYAKKTEDSLVCQACSWFGSKLDEAAHDLLRKDTNACGGSCHVSTKPNQCRMTVDEMPDYEGIRHEENLGGNGEAKQSLQIEVEIGCRGQERIEMFDGNSVEQREAQNKERSLVDHGAVLEALERALKATDAAYLEMADRVLYDNPELMVMGSCVLVMLMKDEDVYIMNVGDSRAVVAQEVPKKGSLGSLNISVAHAQPYSIPAKEADKTGAQDTSLFRLDLDKIIEETPRELECLQVKNVVRSLAPLAPGSSLLNALQLSSDHSTSILEEVLRIKAEHPNDENVIFNDRVKGRLKVTRAFGAGFLKQPAWNNALLKMFRCDFEGTDPYITCIPFLHHHRLSPQDHFLVLSSDGLYQYLSNEEVVCHVEWFMQNFPDGDPAQHLIEELLFRAAKKNGMDFHELLDIPQGDRRKYHDDVYVMVISLEGRIWKSSG